MVALGGTGDQVRATEFIGQSSGILLRLFFFFFTLIFLKVSHFFFNLSFLVNIKFIYFYTKSILNL
jgi:hypothetical protein